MDRILIIAPLTALVLSACAVTPTGYGLEISVAPPLPVVLELGSEPYYVQGGYHYYYDNNRWRYSNSRSGPWTDLPQDRYPRETRYRGQGGGQGSEGRGRD